MLRLIKPPRWIATLFSRYTWRFSFAKKNQLFLTFDDGPHPSITPFILDELKKIGWKATFFCVGENLKKYPEIVARIESEGHSIGNHTQFHDNAFKVSKDEYLSSFNEFNNNYTTSLFRPPYGRINKSIAKEISKTHSIILWSWLSYDYDLTYSIESIFKNIDKVKQGDILVFHDNEKLAQRAHQLFPEVFRLLKEKEFYSSKIETNV